LFEKVLLNIRFLKLSFTKKGKSILKELKGAFEVQMYLQRR